MLRSSLASDGFRQIRFIATLRDWARLGLMLANDGSMPTTVPANCYLRNTIARSWGYGYQTWLLPGERRMFLLLGIHGQDIFVDPQLSRS